jgi:hypothetical protein
MHNRLQTLAFVVIVIALVGAASSPAFGQTARPTKAPASRAVPRLADGHPDLQGTYDLATLTPVERAAGQPLVLTDEQAK